MNIVDDTVRAINTLDDAIALRDSVLPIALKMKQAVEDAQSGKITNDALLLIMTELKHEMLRFRSREDQITAKIQDQLQ